MGSRGSGAKPDGRIAPAFLIVIAATAAAALGLGLWVAGRARAPIEATAGPWHFREVDRELTGQQRSTRVVFLDHGRKLAVLCPRYNKVLFYEVTEKDRLEHIGEANLEGRPVAMAPWRGSLAVLERPSGDDKHLEPGWWHVFSFDGAPRGPRVPAGYYPDDLAVTPDGRLLLVLSSGRAEGDAKKPLPGLDVFEATPREKSAPGEQSTSSPHRGGSSPLGDESDSHRPRGPGAGRRCREDRRLRLGVTGLDHVAQIQASRGDRPVASRGSIACRPDRACRGQSLSLSLSRRRLDCDAVPRGGRGRGTEWS